MDITLPWRDGDSKTVLWRLVRAAGAGGAAVRDLIERSGLSRNTVRNQLANLECDGYVRHPGGGHEHHHRWVPGVKRPPIEGLVLELALEALNDLAQTFGLRPGQVEDGLVALWDAGHVRLDRVGGQLVRAKALVRS